MPTRDPLIENFYSSVDKKRPVNKDSVVSNFSAEEDKKSPVKRDLVVKEFYDKMGGGDQPSTLDQIKQSVIGQKPETSVMGTAAKSVARGLVKAPFIPAELADVSFRAAEGAGKFISSKLGIDPETVTKAGEFAASAMPGFGGISPVKLIRKGLEVKDELIQKSPLAREGVDEGTFKKNVKNPKWWAENAPEALTSFLVPMGAASMALKTKKGTTAIAALKSATTKSAKLAAGKEVAKIAGRGSIAGSMALEGAAAHEQYRDFEKNNPESATVMGDLIATLGTGVVAGGLEGWAGFKAFAPLFKGVFGEGAEKVANKFWKRFLIEAPKTSIREGITEGLQEVIGNIFTKLGYDETQEITEGIAEAMVLGGAMGGMFGTAGAYRQGSQIDSKTGLITNPDPTLASTDVSLPTEEEAFGSPEQEQVVNTLVNQMAEGNITKEQALAFKERPADLEKLGITPEIIDKAVQFHEDIENEKEIDQILSPGATEPVVEPLAEPIAELPIEPIVLTEKSSKEESIKSLQSEMNRYVGEEGEQIAFSLSKKKSKTIDNIANIFGKKVTFFTADSENVPDGISSADNPNQIFIDENSEKPHLNVLGHEVAHKLEADEKEAYDEFVDFSLDYMKQNEAERYRKFLNRRASREKGKDTEISDDMLHRELIADFAGREWQRDGFWESLYEKDQTTFHKVISTIKGMIKRVTEKFQGVDQESDEMFTDLMAMREAYQKVVLKKVGPDEAVKFLERSKVETGETRVEDGKIIVPLGDTASISIKETDKDVIIDATRAGATRILSTGAVMEEVTDVAKGEPTKAINQIQAYAANKQKRVVVEGGAKNKYLIDKLGFRPLGKNAVFFPDQEIGAAELERVIEGKKEKQEEGFETADEQLKKAAEDLEKKKPTEAKKPAPGPKVPAKPKKAKKKKAEAAPVDVAPPEFDTETASLRQKVSEYVKKELKQKDVKLDTRKELYDYINQPIDEDLKNELKFSRKQWMEGMDLKDPERLQEPYRSAIKMPDGVIYIGEGSPSEVPHGELAGEVIYGENYVKNSGEAPFVEGKEAARKQFDKDYKKQIKDSAAVNGFVDANGKFLDHVTTTKIMRDRRTEERKLQFSRKESPEFKSWFKGSKAVDKSGEPIEFYHGFSGQVPSTLTGNIFLAYDKKLAESFAEGPAQLTIPMHLKTNNPLVLDTPSKVKKAWDDSKAFNDNIPFHSRDKKSSTSVISSWAMSNGYDSIMVPPSAFKGEAGHAESSSTWGEPQVISFNPINVKSAYSQKFGQADTRFQFSRKETPFYSRLEELITDFDVKKQPASAWKSTFESWKKKKLPPALQEELEWSGIGEALELMGKQKVSKDQVLSLLQEGGVKVEEKALDTQIDTTDYEEFSVDYIFGQMSNESSLWDNLQNVFNLAGIDEKSFDSIFGNEKKFREMTPDQRTDTIVENIDSLEQFSEEVVNSGKFEGAVQYSSNVLPGGENYKELLITLPKTIGKEKQYKVSPPINTKGNLNEQLWRIVDANDKLIEYTKTEEEAKKRVGQITKASKDESFYSGHFEDTPNVLAWIRFDERTDSEGKKVLFINEIQSDWASEARKKGPTPSLNDSVREDLEIMMGDDPELIGQAQAILEEDLGLDPGSLGIVYGSEDKFLAMNSQQRADVVFNHPNFDIGLYAREHEIQATRESQDNVPDAPFIKSDTAWSMLGLKRAIKYAADNGFDKVAWPGTAEQVYTIEQWGEVITEDVFLVEAKVKGQWVVDGEFYSMKEAEEMVDSNKKSDAISESRITPLGEQYLIQDGDKTVTAIVNRYLKDMPRNANRLLKSQLKTDIKTEKSNLAQAADVVIDKDKALSMFDEGDTIYLGPDVAESRQEIMEYNGRDITYVDETNPINSIDVTPIKEQVTEQGVPLFSRKLNDQDPHPEVQKQLEESSGVKIDKKKQWDLKSLYHESSRTFPQLPRGEHGQFKNIMRVLRDNNNYAANEAWRHVYSNTGKMTKTEEKVFTMNLVLEDMMRDVTPDHEGSTLLTGEEGYPFGYKSVDEIKESVEHFQNEARKSKLVMQALANRRSMMIKIQDNLVDAGLLSDSVRHNRAFFHHQVLEKMALDQNYVFGKHSAVSTKTKGWQKGRKGVALNYNIDYLESEFEVVSQALASLEMDKSKKKIRAIYDKSKGVKAQAKLAKETGEGSENWKDYIPEGHVFWKPDPGSSWYKALTVPEKVYLKIMEGGEVDASSFRSILAKGADIEWVIPKEVADTLDEEGKIHQDPESIAKLSQDLVLAWKKWTLINPLRIVRYNTNNMSGDLDIAIAYDWKILGYMKQSMKDLAGDLESQGRKLPFNTQRFGTKMSPEVLAELKEAHKQGVIGSGFVVHEIADVNEEFSAMVNKSNNLAYRYWQRAKDATNYRENILRLAAYRYFKDRLTKGDKNVYGASNPQEVDDIKSINEKSAKLARELIGDYGGLTQSGNWMRKHMIPFYSWLEINAPRYVKMMRNVKHEGRKVNFGPGMVWRGSKVATKFVAMSVMISMWNNTFFPDEEDDLSDDQRRKMHLILGRRDDGSVRYLPLAGAFRDALSWFGGEDIATDIKEVVKGEVPAGKKIEEVFKAPIEKVWHGSRPIPKLMFETVTGVSTWPDMEHARPIRDRYEHVFRAYSLDLFYKLGAGKPTRGLGTELFRKMGWHSYQPGESAYFQIKGKINKFLKEEGELRRYTPTDKSNALYLFKQALKYNDAEAMDQHLTEYYDLGGTPSGVRGSVKFSSPTGGLPKKLKSKFYKTLTDKDKQMLNLASKWHKKTFNINKSR